MGSGWLTFRRRFCHLLAHFYMTTRTISLGYGAAVDLVLPAKATELVAYFGPNRTPVSEQIEHSFRTKPYSVSLETEHQLALTEAAQDS